MARQEAMTQSDDSQPDGDARDEAHERRAGATHTQARNQLRSASPEETRHLGALLGRMLGCG